MDTSETYILQCQKATEIQARWRPLDTDFGPGDYIVEYESLRGRWIFILPSPMMKPYEAFDARFWLPTQDQLQEMVGVHTIRDLLNIDLLMGDFGGSPVLQSPYDHLAEDCSMEQLWLAFVMHEKYGKKWNGENWVKA